MKCTLYLVLCKVHKIMYIVHRWCHGIREIAEIAYSTEM